MSDDWGRPFPITNPSRLVATVSQNELRDLRALRDAIPGDDKQLVAEWAVKIARQHLISTDRTRYVTAERLNALDALMDATDACPPSVRAALRSNGGGA